MATKTESSKAGKKNYNLNLKLVGEVSVSVQADSFEDAVSQANGLSFSDVVNGSIEDFLDFEKVKLTGLFLND